jgi:hypothetical protein
VVDNLAEQQLSEPLSSSSQGYRSALSPNWVDTWSHDEVQDLQQNDQIIKIVINLKAEGNGPPDQAVRKQADNELKALLNQWDQLEVHNDLLYRKYIAIDLNEPDFMQLVVPRAL